MDIIETITGITDKKKCELISDVIKSFTGGGCGRIQEIDNGESSDETDLLDEYLSCFSQYSSNFKSFYRGLHFDTIEARNEFITQLENGYLINYPTSWTISLSTADNFAKMMNYSLILCLEHPHRIGFVGKLSSNMEFEGILRRKTFLRIADSNNYDKNNDYCFINVVDNENKD